MKKNKLIISGLIAAFILIGVGSYSYSKIKSKDVTNINQATQKTGQVVTTKAVPVQNTATEKSTSTTTPTTDTKIVASTHTKTDDTASKTSSSDTTKKVVATSNTNESTKNLSQKNNSNIKTQNNSQTSDSDIDKLIGPYFFRINNDMDTSNFKDAIKTCDELIPITDKYNLTKKYDVYQRKADAQKNLDAQNMLAKAQQMYDNNNISAAKNELAKVKNLGTLYPNQRSDFESLSKKVNSSNEDDYTTASTTPKSYEQALEMLKSSLKGKADQYTYRLGDVYTNSDGSKTYMIEATNKANPVFGEVYQVRSRYNIITAG